MSWVDSLASVVDGLGVASRLPARGPVIVMYHGLGGEDGVAADAFGAQLDLLRERRDVISLAELVTRLDDPSAANSAAITFDDGYVDFAEIGVPALRARSLHATVFVPSDHIGGWNRWDEGFAARRPILDEAGLRELDTSVAQVGAHGAAHRRMAGLSAAELQAETEGARDRLASVLGRDVDLFAYPYGQRDDFDQAAERAVEHAGFRAACSTSFGRESRSDERFRLRRVGIEASDDLDVVARKLDGAYDWVAWKEAIGFRLRRWRAGPGLAATSATTEGG